MALFSSTDLLSFKAGRSNLHDNFVTSDRRKGKLLFKRDKIGVK